MIVLIGIVVCFVVPPVFLILFVKESVDEVRRESAEDRRKAAGRAARAAAAQARQAAADERVARIAETSRWADDQIARARRVVDAEWER